VRTAPAITVVAAANRPWVAAVRGLALTCVVAVAAWIGAQSMEAGADISSIPVWARCGLLLAAAAVAWRARSIGQEPPVELQWDGQGWWLRPAAAGGEATATTPRVVADLGSWLLVRCGIAPAGRGAERARWLALQQGHDAVQWHALRCALHASLRPGEDASPDDDPRSGPPAATG
jgi:hypothetical protein